jgi:hypothetical protein
MNEAFEDWFDNAITKNLFELTAPSAQHKSAMAAWSEAFERGKNVMKDKVAKRFKISHIDWSKDD